MPSVSVRRPWALAVLAVGCALPWACAKDEPKTEPPPSGPYVVDPATWGREKVRVDESRPAGVGALQVGVATRMIDGPVGTSMAGFGGRGKGRQTPWNDVLKGSAGFYGMQSVKAIAIGVGDERMAFVKSPLMSSESYLTDAIARQLQERHGLDFKGRVITAAGHSHHATARYWPLPELLGSVGADTFDAEVAEGVAGIFADAIAEAWGGRVPAEWAHGHRDGWDPQDEVYRDRRNQNDALYGKDPRLTMMAFRRKADAEPLAVVFNFPIHGTAFGGDNDVFTEDAPGYVEHKFEELFFARTGKPVYGLFANSAGGDASPAGDALGHPTLARLERLGEAAAPKMYDLYAALTGWTDTTELAIRTQRIELVHPRLYAGRPWADEFAGESGAPFLWGAWQCFGEKDAVSMQGKPKRCVDLERFLGLLEASVPNDVAHQVILTMARLGDLWMMTVPGEPNWSIVKYAREKAAAKSWNGKPAELMVVGYSQDHMLYFTSPDDWYLGGYESEMSLWGPGGGVFVADEQLALMDAMIAGKNGPVMFEESPALFEPKTFTPRPREKSVAPGEVVEEPEARVARTGTVRYAVNCGDPALGSPHLRLQRKVGEAFVDVPARHGWKGRAYDNSRYEIVSAYDPDPPQFQHKALPERTHTWRFYWQVPLDVPQGTYRFELACPLLRKGDASAPETVAKASSAFEVAGDPEGATLGASYADRKLTLSLRVPGVPETSFKGDGMGTWSSAGYRLLDHDARHDAPAAVRAPLRYELLGDDDAVLASGQLAFVPEARAHVLSFEADPPAFTRVRAWVDADAAPSKHTAAVAR
jgi:hypothetical protein